MIPESDAIYQLYIRNFTREGDFRAAIPHLPRIAATGFDWAYLTPIHPIGMASRKGSLGSPYAISDYRAINPELGDEADFGAFVDAAHDAGLKLMIDVVYNHTSPDSVLVREHPDWFLRGPDGRPWRKCADWSDVVDFDYKTSPHLWMELIDTLAMWRDRGVDGFRCDVASLVPTDFWKQARMRVNQYDPGARKERVPLVWLAESVHPAFLRYMRREGYGAWSEPELHAAAFDLSYDYDGWERLDKVWRGEDSVERYFEYLYAQETLYPAGAKKLRYLENHDQERAAARFGRGKKLRAWTALYQFLPGVTLAYMGQELALDHRPDLFNRDPMDSNAGDPDFASYFVACLKATKEAKRFAPYFSWSVAPDGTVYCLRSAETTSRPSPVEQTMLKKGAYLLVARPDEDATPLESSTALFDFEGTDLLSQEKISVRAGTALPSVPALLVRLEA